MRLYCEYVVFDFEFSGFVFDFEFFGIMFDSEFFGIVFNFEFFFVRISNFFGEKKPRIFFVLKKTYSCVFETQL